jgi:hypothetical protein
VVLFRERTPLFSRCRPYEAYSISSYFHDFHLRSVSVVQGRYAARAPQVGLRFRYGAGSEILDESDQRELVTLPHFIESLQESVALPRCA